MIFISRPIKPLKSDSYMLLNAHFAVVYTGFSDWGGVPRAMVPFGGGTFFIVYIKNFAVFANTKIFKKCLKNQ